jgi:hypothetical protein
MTTMRSLAIIALLIGGCSRDNARSGWSVRSRVPRCTSGGRRIAVGRPLRLRWRKMHRVMQLTRDEGWSPQGQYRWFPFGLARWAWLNRPAIIA